jgi:hypothetical protein
MEPTVSSALATLAGLTSMFVGFAAQSAPLGAATAPSYQQHSRDVIYDEEPKIIWQPPAVETAVDPDRWIRLRKGAVIAVEHLVIPQSRLTNEKRIQLPERLGGAVPPATQFSRRQKNDQEDACLIRSGRSASEAFIQVCLADSDGDGLHDLASRGGEAIAIAPIRLIPATPPQEAIAKVQRVLVVADLEGTKATLSVHYVVRSGGNFCSVAQSERAPAERKRKQAQWALLLRHNASTTAERLRLKMHKSRDGGWWMNAQGSFSPWASLAETRTVIHAGGRMDCIR